MWVKVERPDGEITEKEIPACTYLTIGDVLEDGSIIIDLLFSDDDDDDMTAYGIYDGEDDEYF
ncbi:MAG TPA: hypothetical protein ENN44_04135 [Methanoculleus sp.]|nr:hypothetical protein [Methanoculleus sp.]